MEQVIALIERAHQGDKEARDLLVKENLGLVWSIVRRFAGRGQEPDDLFQIGTIGLMKAIDKFDTGFDVKFSTYAVPMITGEIKRFLRDDGMIKMSRSIKENAWKIRRAAEKLSYEFGREPTVEELSKETGIELEDIVISMEACTEIESLHGIIYQGDGSQICLEDKIPQKRDDTEICLNHMLTEQLLSILEDSERELIRLRYFEEKTQTEIAKKLGISQVQVSRMEKKILLRMRGQL